MVWGVFHTPHTIFFGNHPSDKPVFFPPETLSSKDGVGGGF